MILEVNSICKKYGKGDASVVALDKISLKINKGDFIAITGASGSGKSTLLHIIGAMDKPDSGDVILDGENINKMKANKLSKVRLNKMGFIFQSFNLMPTLSAQNNVALPLQLSGVSRKKAKESAVALLTKMGLKERSNHFPNEMSGGQKQRVAIARAIINNPLIILADEPTGNLDSESSEIIMKLFESLNKDGHTIIFVTHDINFAQRAKSIIKIKDGRIIKNE